MYDYDYGEKMAEEIAYRKARDATYFIRLAERWGKRDKTVTRHLWRNVKSKEKSKIKTPLPIHV